MAARKIPDTNEELNKAAEQFDKFDENVKSLTLDRMNATAKKDEAEPQAKFSQKELEKKPDQYLKPKRTISSKEKFNEAFRQAWEFDKEYVHFQAQNNEIIGESIELWTKPYAGVPAEEWVIPVNKPLWGPRYLAEQIKRKFYHRLMTEDKAVIGSDGTGTYHGQMIADKIINRLDAFPVNTQRKSVFMGANSF
jgi:hypothetical protein